MLSILLPAARRTDPGKEQTAWDDLRVALASIKSYAPGVEVVVGWSGDQRPEELPSNPCMRLIERPPGYNTGSEAWNYCATQTDADELLILGDDAVLHPDSLTLLLEDVTLLQQHPDVDKLGFVGARSNYVKGPQNIRSANGGVVNGIRHTSEDTIMELDMVVPVFAWVRHEVFDEVSGFVKTNWFADDLICWDLKNRGYRHFASRSYVHHVGQRASAQGKTDQEMLDIGLSWLRANRPDFLTQQLGIPA